MDLVRDALVDALKGIEVLRVDGPGGRQVRAAFVPAQTGRGKKIRGSVILAPGRTEFIEKYADVAAAFVQRGFAVAIIDQRGQGLSDRLAPDPMAGHLDSYADAAVHLGQVIEALDARLPGPRVLVGHSMGGAIGLEGLLNGVLPGITAAAFSAPMWGLVVPPWARLSVRVMMAAGQGETFAPTVPRVWSPDPFDGNAVTHDPAAFARNNALFQMEPRLQIGGVTNGWLEGAFTLFDSFTPERLARLALPVLVLSAEAETVVDNTSHARIAGQLPNAKWRTVPGAKHELLHERPDLRAQTFAHLDAWLDEVLAV